MSSSSIRLGIVLAACAALAGCIETDGASENAPEVTVRSNGQTSVVFNNGCQVLYSHAGNVVFRDTICNRKQMQRARAAYKNAQ